MHVTAVIGVGNPRMADDGVGVHLVRVLSRTCELPGVMFFETGTAPLAMASALSVCQTAVILDCALMGEEPGTLRWFGEPEAAEPSILGGGRTFAHEGSLLGALHAWRAAGTCPRAVVFFAVQPQRVCRDDRLSPTLRMRFPAYVTTIAQWLQAHAVPRRRLTSPPVMGRVGGM